MSISESNFKFSFKIEPKPEGGFIARCDNPDWTLEGATREEVEGKIRAKIAEIAGIDIASALPLEKLGQAGVNVNIQKKSTFSSRRAGDKPITDASTGQIESPTPAAIEPSGISLTTLIRVLIVLGILLILLVLLRR